jgi:hypothetical protein
VRGSAPAHRLLRARDSPEGNSLATSSLLWGIVASHEPFYEAINFDKCPHACSQVGLWVAPYGWAIAALAVPTAACFA